MKAIAIVCATVVLCASAGCRPFDAGLREQAIANDSAKRLLDAVVTKKIAVGDSIEHAQEVLSYAGLDFRFETSAPELRSVYRTGAGSGFTISITFNAQRKITKVVVEPFFTGL